MSSTDDSETSSLTESISIDSHPPYEVDPDGDITLFTPETPLIDIRKGNVEGNYAQFRVFSRHLTLAIPYFKGMLKDCWPAGHTLLTEGSVKISIKDCKPDVLLIILNIIHGHLRRVPRKISLQQLTDIAIATEFFQCYEVMEVFAGIWIEALRRLVPTSFSENLKNCIMIAWVFKCYDILKQTTKVAMQQGTGPFVTSNLPIPKTIKDQIDQARERYMKRFETIIAARIKKLLQSSSGDLSSYSSFESRNYCAFQCDTIQLGSLMRIMARNKISCSIDMAPRSGLVLKFTGLSPSSISSIIMYRDRKSRCPHHYECISYTYFGARAKAHAEKLNTLLPGCNFSS